MGNWRTVTLVGYLILERRLRAVQGAPSFGVPCELAPDDPTCIPGE